MKKLILGDLDALRPVRQTDPRLMSYNIEMTEVTGGTFWKEYTPGQIAGKEEFPALTGFADLGRIMQWYDPIDLSGDRLRKLARALGPCWIRVSGSWATKTYYDLDNTTGGKVPQGFQSILTRQQWEGVLDFVRATEGKLLISLGNCPGNHPGGGPLDLSQAEAIFGFSRDYGVPIDAVEFMNEPNMLTMSGAPGGYTAGDFARDQDLVHSWVREHYPDCLLVGPCSLDSGILGAGAPDSSPLGACTTDQLMEKARILPDVFSYHCYNGVSERLASVMPGAHWPPEAAATEAYLAMAGRCARAYLPYRDRYSRSRAMWVTEAGDAGGGGDTWASTCLDVLRTLNELGQFSLISEGVIFHNTLASSDYGFLHHGDFLPRPNYFAVLLWNRLMGTQVFDSGIPIQEGAHVYVHSRRDGKPGKVILAINNSLTEETRLDLPADSLRYTLGGETLRSTVLQLNGKDLVLSDRGDLPALEPVAAERGPQTLACGSCTFFVI